MPDQKTLNARVANLLNRVHLLRDSFGLSAAVYTQTTDVETECNGLMTYDRAVAKLDPAVARDVMRNEAREKPYRVIASNALYGRVTWKYTTNGPAAQWFAPAFDDSGWKEGVGGFGTKGTPGTLVNTTWDTPDIWLRREFKLNHEDLRGALLQLHHDEDVEIYLNGVLAARAPEFVTSYDLVKINPEAIAALKPGVNVMAVHCHQSRGGQYIDVGIVLPHAENPQAASKD
jgi:hypothetical protein